MSVGQKAPEILPIPGPIGRSVRILAALVLLLSFMTILKQASGRAGGFLAARAGWRIPGGDWWVAAIICLLALPMMIDSGFGRRWGGQLQLAFIALLAAAAIWDREAYDRLWALPLSALILGLILYVIAHAGISFLVAGTAATPG